jgi:hypothetical protein
MEWVDKILSGLGSVEGMSATLIVVLEFVFRLLPTKKPLSILHLGAKLIHQGAVIVDGVSSILKKLAKILDTVLPQNSADKK